MKLKIYLIPVLLSLLSVVLTAPLKAAETLSFVHQDHLGSTTLVTDIQGKKVSKQVYYPYGETRTTEGTLATERHYTGQVSDKEDTGLLYYNARYYDPKIGKFTQADRTDVSNRYVYAKNNPFIYKDINGLKPCSVNKSDKYSTYDIDCGWEEERQSYRAYNLNYIAQATQFSCGPASIAMFMGTFQDVTESDINVEESYNEAFEYFYPDDNDDPLTPNQLADYLNDQGFDAGIIKNSNNTFLQIKNKPAEFAEILKRQGGSVIAAIDVNYKESANNFNHWVVVDNVINIDGNYYIQIRDPYRSGDPNISSFGTPIEGVTSPYQDGSILVPWYDFFKTYGGVMIGLNDDKNRKDIKIRSGNNIVVPRREKKSEYVAD